MKIAIPVEESRMETAVCVSFGRTPYFLIYDTETRESLFLINSAAENKGGAGIKAAQTIVDSEVYAVLTPRCGENAASVLKAAGIKMYKTINATARENIDAFTADRLPLLEEIHAGFHGHGGN